MINIPPDMESLVRYMQLCCVVVLVVSAHNEKDWHCNFATIPIQIDVATYAYKNLLPADCDSGQLVVWFLCLVPTVYCGSTAGWSGVPFTLSPSQVDGWVW